VAWAWRPLPRREGNQATMQNERLVCPDDLRPVARPRAPRVRANSVYYDCGRESITSCGKCNTCRHRRCPPLLGARNRMPLHLVCTVAPPVRLHGASQFPSAGVTCATGCDGRRDSRRDCGTSGQSGETCGRGGVCTSGSSASVQPVEYFHAHLGRRQIVGGAGQARFGAEWFRHG
jgi:hypothetical protein